MSSKVLASIRQRADTTPDAPALHDGVVTLSYVQLVARIESLAKALHASSARCVAIEMENGIEWVLADLACLESGIPTLPLPPFFTPSQREHALRGAGANACFTSGLQLQLLPYEAVLLPDGTAKITFTSGSTGEPKGICLTAQGMEQVALSLHEILGDEVARHTAALLPLGVLLENVAGCYTTLLAGGCYDVRPLKNIGMSQKSDFVKLHHYLRESKATACILVPELLRGLLASSPIALPDMRFMAVGGASVSPALLKHATSIGLPVYEGYGLTESASVVAVNTPHAHKVGSAGRVLPHMKATVASDGEIILLASAMAGSPPSTDYATGDIGFIDNDGFLHITGRKKNILITTHGRNISPEWPETELLAQPSIYQAMVVGDAMPSLAALIVSSASDDKVEQAIANANGQLPLYAQICHWRRVPAFTAENGLLTGNGRIRREQIARIHNPLIQSIYEAHHDTNLL